MWISIFHRLSFKWLGSVSLFFFFISYLNIPIPSQSTFYKFLSLSLLRNASLNQQPFSYSSSQQAASLFPFLFHKPHPISRKNSWRNEFIFNKKYNFIFQLSLFISRFYNFLFAALAYCNGFPFLLNLLFKLRFNNYF